MKQDERRMFERRVYRPEGIAVVCDTQRVLYVGVRDISPGGVGITLTADAPYLLGEDLILVADTMIMYANVVRQFRQEDGTWRAGLAAKKFTTEVLMYLFDSIELKSKEERRDEE